MSENKIPAPARSRALQINKGLVLEALNAACLIGSWARWVKGGAHDGPEDWADADIASDIESWSLVVELTSPELAYYDQIPRPEELAAIITGLSVALLLSSDEHEYFDIRREWLKIERWLKQGHGLDPRGHGCALLEDGGSSLNSLEHSLDLIARYLPELKQGWNDGKAQGVQDYLTVIRLKLQHNSH